MSDIRHCPHPAGQQRAISDFMERRQTTDGHREWVRETVVCGACGQRRTMRTLLADDSPESGIYKPCPRCGVRVFTTRRGPQQPHTCG